MDLSKFKETDNFLTAIRHLFKEDLDVPMNIVNDEPTSFQEAVADDLYKENETTKLVDDVYFVGMIDDAAFDGNESLAPEKIETDYDGILVFGITLGTRGKGLLPTRTQLAEISRALNRTYKYTPVVSVFKYADEQKEYLAFANTERLKYKQEWREGEKAGKVSLLRDIDIVNPHAGHKRIIEELKTPKTGKKEVNSFTKLYNYWQEVFNVSILNKKFYQELSNWYFWAINHVKFPNEPTIEDVLKKYGVQDEKKLKELKQEHNSTNIIRLLTRLLFVWFMKEKKLVPKQLFELDALQEKILKDISPYHEKGMFKDANKESIYYKAILQNLFFASLNCPIDKDGLDKRSRRFRLNNHYGQDRGNDWMYRYKKYFKDPDAFVELMNENVPFLNGGLFECLDIKEGKNLYIDGFSDQMTKGEQLVVPDYLFFGAKEHVDLSPEYGVKNKGTKQAAVKGLINILDSYKFTVTENTPVEEDVALDPELLGKVFENLLASYNPETKTTARKQTGSFYTPREIVNYMVDESLIAYLKNAVTDWNLNDEELDQKLHQLSSFDSGNPFAVDEKLTKQIIKAIDECKILDPACGSGAFPMGVLQKMVHMLIKLDPENILWTEVQKNKAKQAADNAFDIADKEERSERLREIDEAFDRNINDPDYARKLYLIENCIYGVDIQPIATQISKLRFFISLVVDQRKNEDKPNFGVRALPNLETKFVAAHTLIGIEKPQAQTSLFDTPKVKEIRSKLFSAKTKETKRKYRKQDEKLRNAIADELKSNGWPNDTAEKLAAWDPYDQNASSTFFDPEWMFDVKAFDVVIGNPPYINANELKKRLGKSQYELLKSGFEAAKGTIDIYILFFEFGLKILSEIGQLTYISPNRYLSASYGKALRTLIFDNYRIVRISDFSSVRVFEAASTYPIVSQISRDQFTRSINVRKFNSRFEIQESWENDVEDLDLLPGRIWGFLLNSKIRIVKQIISESLPLKSCGKINATSTAKEADEFHDLINEKNGLKLVNTGTIDKYMPLWGINKLTDKGESYLNPYLDISNNIVSNQRKKLYQTSKIILAKIGLSAEAFYDENGEYASINTNCIHTFNKEFSPKYVTLWLNSSLYHFLFSCFFDGLRMAGGYLLFSAPNLQSTYIKNPLKSENWIYETLHDMERWQLKASYDRTYNEVIDGSLFNLYFPDHMKEREIDVLEFVERDMQKALQGREFDSLEDAEKEKVIEQLHTIWSHPDNEVVKRMAQFKEKSPEILKPVLES